MKLGKAVILAAMGGILLLTGCLSANPESVVSSENPTIITPPPSPAETVSPSPAESTASDPVSEPSPGPTPTPDPEERLKNYAAEMLSRMDLHERVCQMFMVLPETLSEGEAVKTAGATVMHTLHEYPVGGVILMGENIESEQQVRSLISNLQCFAGVDLFVGVDEEGGCVSRVQSSIGTWQLDDMYYYREGGTQIAYENARAIAESLYGLGFNLDFAPVADVWTNPENSIIGTRAYSDNYQEAASLVASAVQGFSDGGILCTLKHFPGHGNTNEDSHDGNAYSYRTLAELRDGEFLPFMSGAAAGAPMIMASHITVPELDDQPASLSYTILTEVLRDELGFDGIIVTDAMNMGAIANTYYPGEAEVLAIEAGADLILCPSDLTASVLAVETAVIEGTISANRIDESVLRIMTLKLEQGIIPVP